MDSNHCLICQSAFERQKNQKGWKRISLRALGFSPSKFGGQDGYICWACRKSTTVKQTPKVTLVTSKKRVIRTPANIRTPKVRRLKSPKSFKAKHQPSFKERAKSAINDSKYVTAIKALLENKNAREACYQIIRKQVHSEIKRYPCKSHLSKPISVDNIKNWKWQEVVKEAALHMPLLVHALMGSLPDPAKSRPGQIFCSRKVTSSEEAKSLRDMRMGFILSVILYSHKLSTFKFIQSCVSLQLWKHGCSQRLLECLHGLGICKGRSTTSKTVDTVCSDSKNKQQQWQLSLCTLISPKVEGRTVDEVSAPVQRAKRRLFVDGDGASDSCDSDSSAYTVVTDTGSSVDSSVDSTDVHLSLQDGSPERATVVASKKKETQEENLVDVHGSVDGKDHVTEVPGYCIVWDNVQIQTTTRRQSRGQGNKFKLWALAFAVKNRISFSNELDCDVTRASSIPLSKFLPCPSDWDHLKDEVCVIVERILKMYLPFLSKVKSVPPADHMYSEEMRCKSEMVNLGVVEANPSSTSGTVQIMEYLHNFVPTNGQDMYPIVAFGDGLSVERMFDSKRARATGETSRDRLEGLVPCPQEFHKRGLLFQDTLNLFFKGNSAAQRGTLYQLKQDFNHKSVQKKVMENFNHVADFLQFTTHSYCTMLAMKLAHFDKASETPSSFPSSQHPIEQSQWLSNLAQEVVNFIWPQLPVEEVSIACSQQEDPSALDNVQLLEGIDDSVDAEDDGCRCGESTGEDMVRCANYDCGWFHYSCVQLEEVPDGDWWCSSKCTESKAYIYCHCHEKTGREDEMIQCEMQDSCTQNEWYHPDCVDGADDLPDKWFCCTECEKKGSKEMKDGDGILEYSKALLYDGLYHLALRDAVRAGDGPAMMRHWRINMLQFWKNNHFKYFILGHHMLAGVNGFYPARIAKEITWNRVANLTGREKGNLGLDLVNEFMNRDYKEMLKRSKGVYTKENVQRCSQMSGAFSRELDDIFMLSVAGSESKSTRHHHAKHERDVQHFLEEYKDDRLFDFVPGRYHRSFQHFKHSLGVKSPEKLGLKLVQKSKNMDAWKSFVQ